MPTYPSSSSHSSLMGYTTSVCGADEDTVMAEQNPHSSCCFTIYGGASLSGIDQDNVMTEHRHGLKRSLEEEDDLYVSSRRPCHHMASSSSTSTGSFHGNKAQRRTKELLSAAPSSNPWARRYPSTLLEDAHARLLIEFYGPETVLSTLLAFDDELGLNFEDDEDEDDDGHDDMRAEF